MQKFDGSVMWCI